MLNWYNYGEHALRYLGLARGYFAEEGIDLEIQEGRGSGTALQAVAAGSATFGYADLGTMIEAAEKEPAQALEALLKANPKAGKPKILKEGLARTLPLFHSKYTQGKRPWRVAAEDMKMALDLMVEYGGVDPATKGKPEDCYTKELLP
jgi:ABC-type nitrate/sulfonate/bicarbonate transport system substrate-binding protein